MSYIFWGEGQPNNYNREQNCAVLDSQLDWRWNDLSCKVNFRPNEQNHLSTEAQGMAISVHVAQTYDSDL